MYETGSWLLPLDSGLSKNFQFNHHIPFTTLTLASKKLTYIVKTLNTLFVAVGYSFACST